MIHLRAQLMKDLQVGGPDAIRYALQLAIKLEHATIPLYLYALYSLNRAKNPLIANTILAVVMGDLIVHLAPYSRDQLSAFMTVEEPETILEFPVALAAGVPTKVTIGQFYAEIKRQIGLLDSSAFVTPPRNQVSGILGGDFEVTDLPSANKAIDTIVRQGEGTKESPLGAVDAGNPAHFYRFAEILFGKKLIKNPAATPETPPDKQFIYGGAPIPFDATGVFPVPSDPTAAGYPAGPARLACQNFNFKYTSMLKSLHDGFNGDSDALNDAVFSLMPELRSLALQMTSGSNPAGMNIGPSFEYQPTAPT